ncbi:MAG: hypothetical protein HY645_06605 [Acidobacteria bacterium]|nr:hypothetical protein [Acidobacteriota bacterium]
MKIMVACIVSLVLMQPLFGQQVWEFEAEWLRLGRNQKGILKITGTEIEYVRKERRLSWRLDDIQQLKLEPQKIEILTYEDQKWRFGKDRKFRFKVSEPFSAELSEFLRSRISGVFVSALLPAQEERAAFLLPVKHQKFLSGSEGVLQILGDRIVFRSEDPEDSRSWLYREIQSFAITSDRELELVSEEKSTGGPTRTFRFQVKALIPEGVYDYLWVRIFGSSYYPPERKTSAPRQTVG